MSNSYLFNTAPDWASIIGDSYRDPNEQEDRNESLEKQNDQTRIQEAGVPLAMLKSVMEFSGKAKKLANAMEDKAVQNAKIDAAWSGAFDYLDGKDTLLEELNGKGETIDNKEIAKHRRDRNILKARTVKENSVYKNTRQKIVAIKNLGGDISNIHFDKIKTIKTKSGKQHGDLGLTSAEENELYQKFLANHVIQPLMDQGISARLIRKHMYEDVQNHKAGIMQKHNEKMKAEFDAIEAQEFRDDARAVLNTNDYLTAFSERIEITAPTFGDGNVGKKKAAEAYFTEMVAMANAGDETVTHAKVRAIMENYYIDHAGSGKVLFTKQFPDIKNALETALVDGEDKLLERESKKQTNYQKDFNNNITEIEKKRGYLMSGPELAKHIKENYDITQGGPISDDIKNRLTFEEHEDDLTEPLLENLWDKGLLTERDVRKLNSAELRETWTPRIGTISPKGVSDDQLKDAIKQAEGFANAQAKSQGKPAGRNNTQWTNIVDNAKYMFPSLYADEMQSVGGAGDEASKRIAYVNAVKRMEALIKGNSWDELVVPESDTHQRKRTLVFGERQLELDPNAFQKDIIYGSESILEQAEALHEKGQVHLYYKQMAQKIEVDGIPMHPMALQETQLNIARKKKGLDELPKSEMLKAYEALPPSVRTTLAQKVTPAVLIQAKIDAFGSDADITYNEIQFLLEGILDEEFNRKEYKMTEEVVKEEITPTYSDRRSKMRKTREGDGVAAEKAKEFIGGVVQFPADYIKDVFATEAAVFSMIGEGLEERRKEVELQNKSKKRKRY